MTTYISIVTMNRLPILTRVLDAIEATTRDEDVQVLVTDNASTDGTPEMLRRREAEGRLRAWCLPENLGTSGGRNAHWAECIGHDAIRMDDKVLPLAAGWVTCLRALSEANHSLVCPPYDPAVQILYRIAPCISYVDWPKDAGRGGPCIFIPGEVSAALGGIDELDPGCKYGWDDLLGIERAALLGWRFGFSLCLPVEYLTHADPARRNSALDWHALYIARRKEYEEAERDLFIPIEETRGYKAGLEARR